MSFFSDNPLTSFRDVLEGCEPGDYDFEGVVVSVRELKEVVPALQVINPTFELSLLNIE